VTSATGPGSLGADPPGWLTRLAAAAGQFVVPEPLVPPPSGGRPSAVLILFAEDSTAQDSTAQDSTAQDSTAQDSTAQDSTAQDSAGPDLLLVQRSPFLRSHAGQPAFPGGVIDPGDGGPVGAALREAAEETLVDPAAVDVLAVLPELFIARSGFSVTPVLGWWRRPGPVSPGDPAEIAAVRRVLVADLANPANRLTVRHPSGHGGPAFRAGDMLIWGFTGLVVDRLLALGGWEVPWDTGNETAPPEVLTG
jgi:8-oxo-dGTP pyrophosphatase MutT (NUDIX family)